MIIMRIRRLFGMTALACLLAVQIAGCAGTKISSRNLCAAAGGVYSGGACNPGKTMKAVEMCQSQAGNYDYGTDTCELPSDRTK
jgi:hypothetical protein